MHWLYHLSYYSSLYLFIIIHLFICIYFLKFSFIHLLEITHLFIHSFIYSLISLFTHSFTDSFTYLFISLTHSFIHLHSFCPSFTPCPFTPFSMRWLIQSLTLTCSSLFPSTASYQEAEPASWLGPLVLNPRTFPFILTSNLLNCAGMCPGVQRICFPLRNRCFCNYCFDFHPPMPENPFHKLLQHAMRQPVRLSRACSARGPKSGTLADSWQSELQGI